MAVKTGGGRTQVLDICWVCLALPGLLVVGVMFILPILLLLSYSFIKDGRNGRLIWEFTTQNYLSILTDPFYLRVLWDTVLLGAMVGGICAVLAYPVAYYLARNTGRMGSLLNFLVILPLITPVVIRNIGWVPILGETGAINYTLRAIGLIDQPLKLINNFTGVVIGLVNSMLPYMILMLVVVIRRVKSELEEAAANLGASRFQLFRYVMIPLTRRGLSAGFLLVFTMAVSAYTTPAVMGGRRVLVMSTFVEQQIHYVLKFAFGSALAIVLLVSAIVLGNVASRYIDREELR